MSVIVVSCSQLWHFGRMLFPLSSAEMRCFPSAWLQFGYSEVEVLPVQNIDTELRNQLVSECKDAEDPESAMDLILASMYGANGVEYQRCQAVKKEALAEIDLWKRAHKKPRPG